MDSQEFRQSYLELQDNLGNNLQTLSDLTERVNTVIQQINSNYIAINTMVDTFLTEQESVQPDGGTQSPEQSQ